MNDNFRNFRLKLIFLALCILILLAIKGHVNLGYAPELEKKSIIIDKQTADNNAQTVAAETGAKVYVLDSMLGGGEGYIEIIEQNLKIVESME